MAGLKEIQDRIRSVQDTRKITGAMYMISSTKMKKARHDLEKTEPYFYNGVCWGKLTLKIKTTYFTIKIYKGR